MVDTKNKRIIKDKQRTVGWNRFKDSRDRFGLDGEDHPPHLLIDLLADLVAKLEKKATITHVKDLHFRVETHWTTRQKDSGIRAFIESRVYR